MSKGSAPRPISVSQEQYAARWDAIFGKDVPEPDGKDIVTDAQEIRETFEKMEDEDV